jgi:hypothetical protein
MWICFQIADIDIMIAIPAILPNYSISINFGVILGASVGTNRNYPPSVVSHINIRVIST